MREDIPQTGYKIRVKPAQQMKVLLGTYESKDVVKGFVVETSSKYEDAVNVEVIRLDNPNGYKLFMNIANFDEKPIDATIKRFEKA